jgi:hypothetical protein
MADLFGKYKLRSCVVYVTQANVEEHEVYKTRGCSLVRQLEASLPIHTLLWRWRKVCTDARHEKHLVSISYAHYERIFIEGSH